MEKREHPILFSGPMVRAILEDRKTQTRRVIRPQFGTAWGQGCPNESTFALMNGGQKWKDAYAVNIDRETASGHWEWLFCPFGRLGDRLWVRETWSDAYCTVGSRGRIRYRADNDPPASGGWSSPIYMPRWASRITLEITSVRVERLQQISEDDAEAEGIRSFTKDGSLMKYWICDPWDGDLKKPWQDLPRTRRAAFAAAWNAINSRCGFGWDANPWVWVIEFKRLDGRREQ